MRDNIVIKYDGKRPVTFNSLENGDSFYIIYSRNEKNLYVKIDVQDDLKEGSLVNAFNITELKLEHVPGEAPCYQTDLVINAIDKL